MAYIALCLHQRNFFPHCLLPSLSLPLSETAAIFKLLVCYSEAFMQELSVTNYQQQNTDCLQKAPLTFTTSAAVPKSMYLLVDSTRRDCIVKPQRQENLLQTRILILYAMTLTEVLHFYYSINTCYIWFVQLLNCQWNQKPQAVKTCLYQTHYSHILSKTLIKSFHFNFLF